MSFFEDRVLLVSRRPEVEFSELVRILLQSKEAIFSFKCVVFDNKIFS